ncbi:RagB/SusD family nutrient uptake outer membrane protein [Agriterribacter sp.]|uniref:RagB/SusD family nutrient uptake outer membrane protein n=1 Tax=Agriterribacter sp. TaxID=2821509 RepID=UPI002D10AEEE|nr:RagB/SusD family nutrient uptake outer membrane protein [Agriterribacter sp.]HTN05484.1 RagB/SusD family nutrient uptake outer membrane protein [Agriterribacter sp.]
MKYLSIISLSLLVLVTGCSKLEPRLYSDLTTANAYSTESDINAALVGIYADLNPYPGDAWMYYAGYLVMTTDYTTDMGFSTAAGDPTKLSNFTYDANNRYIRYNWQYMYNIVSNVNLLLSKIEGVQMDDVKKKRIIAQARFLRALAYRDITDAWGAAPLYTTVIPPDQTANAPLASVAEIDELIIEDCKYGLDNLPEAWDESEGLSRATKGACATLLGNVYIRAHDYQNAKTYVDMVLAMKDAGIYQLNSDFKNVWSESNKFDKGFIFCILHEPGMNGGEIANHFGPADHKEVTDRWQYYAVSLEFWRKYSDQDPRKQFFYYNYEGASPRDEHTTHGFYYMVPAPGQTTPPSDTVKLLKNIATKKYSYEMVSNSYYDGRTIAIFRIEDVILYKAEIENELNGPTAALPYINQIRARAGAPEYGSGGAFPAPASKEEMAQKILDERGYELVFEYKRRPDLIRFGKYEAICNAYLTSRGLNPVVTANMKYLPYPLLDAQLNSGMAAENLNRVP